MRSFACKDVGLQDCPWTTTGQTDEDIMNHAEQHGREKHGIKEMTQDLINKVKGVIQDKQDVNAA